LNVLSCPDFEFWYSPLLRLETMLQPTRENRALEVDFYSAYFSQANCYGDMNRIFEIGERDSPQHAIPVMDAMHVAAASLARCAALITTEKVTKPMFRTRLIRILSITDPAAGGSTSNIYRRVTALISA
jgi:hypothetical protein